MNESFFHSSSYLALYIQIYSSDFLQYEKCAFSGFFCCEETRANSLTPWPSDFMSLWLSNTLTHSASLLPTTAGLQWVAKSHPANRKFQSSHLERHFRLEYNDWTVCTSTIAYSTYCFFCFLWLKNPVIRIWLGAIMHNWNHLRFNIYLYG